MNSKSKPKILVVDDQPINIKLLQRKLERQGMEVLIAYNGRDCIETVKRTPPDLILLDVMMPEMDGIETCHLLKADPTTETVPIIFITAKASKEGKLEGLEAGAVDYITKPIDLDETLARVRTQLRLQEMFRENMELQDRLADVRKSAAIGSVTQGIAHNLNNLLGVVVGYIDLIKNGYDSPEMVQRSIGLMDNAVSRMVGIIRQLSKIASNDRIEFNTLEIEPLLWQSIKRFKSDLKIDPPVELNFITEGKVKFSANAEIFEVVLGKLLINAWESYPKEIPDSERFIYVEVGINRERGPALLDVSVRDRGQGISPAIAENLFDPFVTSKTAVGRGMGLTIARHTMRNLDGEIRVKNNSDGPGVTASMLHPL